MRQASRRWLRIEFDEYHHIVVAADLSEVAKALRLPELTAQKFWHEGRAGKRLSHQRSFQVIMISIEPDTFAASFARAERRSPMQRNSMARHWHGQEGMPARRAAIIVIAFACCQAASATPTHPLDPLDAGELIAVRDILAHSGQFSSNTNFAWISLAEPPKKIVENFRPGSDFPREAYVAAIDYDKGKSFRVIIDLRSSRIASLDDLGGLHPGLNDVDIDIAADIIDADPKIKAALSKRGLDIPDRVTDFRPHPLHAGWCRPDAGPGKQPADARAVRLRPECGQQHEPVHRRSHGGRGPLCQEGNSIP